MPVHWGKGHMAENHDVWFLVNFEQTSNMLECIGWGIFYKDDMVRKDTKQFHQNVIFGIIDLNPSTTNKFFTTKQLSSLLHHQHHELLKFDGTSKRTTSSTRHSGRPGHPKPSTSPSWSDWRGYPCRKNRRCYQPCIGQTEASFEANHRGKYLRHTKL